MPVVIPKTLPAFKILSNENIFVMPKVRAESQDIRPLEIAIVNLMPTKIETETQLMRLLGNSSLQVNVTLVGTESYKGHVTAQDHMETFYTTFSKIKNRKFDGMIITGAPVEKIEFNEIKRPESTGLFLCLFFNFLVSVNFFTEVLNIFCGTHDEDCIIR